MRIRTILVAAVAALLLTPSVFLFAQATSGEAVRVKVTAEQANLRERPDIGSAVVQQIPEGTVLAADRKEGEWYLVRYTLEDGGVIAGYIHESLVLVTAQEPGPPARDVREPETVTPVEPRPRPPVVRTARAPRPAGPVARPFELSVSLLGGPVGPSDLNDGTQGLIDYHAAFLGLDASGSADPVRLALGLGLELTYRLSPELSVGLGLDHLRGGNRSRATYEGELFTETLTVEPAFQALPAKLLVRFYPGRGFYLKGALGAAHVKAGYLYRYERGEDWLQHKGSATAWTFGGEAAFGGDWDVGRNLVFFAEAGFRLARWSGLKGKNVLSGPLGEPATEEGSLYFWRMTLDDSSYPFLYVREVRPGGPEASAVRTADINLTGTSLRAGLRFRF
jgi:hypothetical protein